LPKERNCRASFRQRFAGQRVVTLEADVNWNLLRKRFIKNEPAEGIFRQGFCQQAKGLLLKAGSGGTV